jgi:hypothetical protein
MVITDDSSLLDRAVSNCLKRLKEELFGGEPGRTLSMSYRRHAMIEAQHLGAGK